MLRAMDKEALERLLFALLPMVKLNEQGKHLIGTQVKVLSVKEDGQVVLEGDTGETDLATWIEENGAHECVEFTKLLQEMSKVRSIVDAVAATNEQVD